MILHLALKIVMRRQRRLRGKEQIGKNIVIWIFSVVMMMHGGVVGSE